MKATINKLGLFFILLDNFFKVELSFDFRIQYVLYLTFILYFIISNNKIKLNLKGLFLLFVVVLFFTLIPIFKHANFANYLKQFILIFFNLTFSYFLLNAYKFDINKIFDDYADLIFIASIVGLLQAISLLINFHYGADFSYLGFAMGNFNMDYTRIQSWFEEPSAMVYAFMPVVFACMCRLFKLTDLISIRKAIFIIFAFFLTQSSVGLIGILLSVVIIVATRYSFFRRPHVVVALSGVIVLLAWGFYQIPLVKIRVDDSVKIFFDDDVTSEEVDKINISTYALYSNFKVTTASLSHDLLLGTGLGTYESNYDKYIDTVIPPSYLRTNFPLNKKDANSMLLRIASETGLVGLIVFVLIITRNRFSVNFKSDTRIKINYWVISNGILVMILIKLLRQGHYTVSGFVFFILIYLYIKDKVRLITLNP